MKSWRYLGVLGFICLMGFLFLWHTLPTRAQSSGAGTGKPALYEFGSKYCIPCKEMQKVMADLKAQYGEQLEVRMIYADEEKDLFGKFKVMLIPAQVFLDASGKEVDRHMGALPKEEVIKELKELKFIQ
jgi:thioredoxin 1